MTFLIENREGANRVATSQTIAQRLQSQAERPRGQKVHAVIDRYMRQYAGKDHTRGTRLRVWIDMIGEVTLEETDSDLIHACREELNTRPALNYKGKDHEGHKIFRAKKGAKVKGNATLNRYMVAISAVFTWAMEKRLTPKGWSNPCRGIKRLEEDSGRVRFLDEDERARLFEAVKAAKYPRLHAMVLMAMKTGARRGELEQLRWRDVDLTEGLARLGQTKNGDRRTLVLLPDVLQTLAPFQSIDPDRLLFGSVRSKYTKPADVTTAWREALARAQIKNFHFHDLRHCCASYMAQAGIPLNIIADVLGHRRLDMTRRYAHLTTQTKASAMLASLGEIK